ncbi:MAG: hypothetical protein GY925_13570 [Actinomycetia bacterium]|nr:hypothetical protein [Actinomycetes bacterium]
MPEIPEIRAHAERLSTDFAGAELAKFRPITFTVLKTFSPRPEDAYGRTLDSVTSHAKYLMLNFGDITFVVHLMQGGRLRPDNKQSAKPRGGQARWVFADRTALLLTEPGTERRAGVWVVTGDPVAQEPMATLGPEATSLAPDELLGLLNANNMRLHGFLRRQNITSGLGRRLANEICHRAKLSPFAMTGKLGIDEATAIHSAIHETVDQGLAYDRTREDMSKSSDRPSAVHARAGDACPICDDEVRAVEYRKYTVNYCPTCQTSGKILADNTTSKFLK